MSGLDPERDKDNHLLTRWWYWVGIVNLGLMDKAAASVHSEIAAELLGGAELGAGQKCHCLSCSGG